MQLESKDTPKQKLLKEEEQPIQSICEGIKIDGYELLGPLGEGGFGIVFRARQKSTGQLVALKMLQFNEILEEQHRKRQRERFERETQLCAELNHPHIVKLLDKGHTENGSCTLSLN